jgi:hypothetical protein
MNESRRARRLVSQCSRVQAAQARTPGQREGRVLRPESASSAEADRMMPVTERRWRGTWISAT